VHQGTIGAIDTATYAAVLAIDTVAARYAGQVGHYVRSGGGLVLWSAAATVPAFAVLAPGTSGALLPDQGDVPSDPAPRAALALTPLTQLRPDALVLERQRQQPALAARRIGPGRVVQIGYVDIWRWRMAGLGADAPAAHRVWLARVVADVAYTRRWALPAPVMDVAPLATLVDRLGPASAPEPPEAGTPRVGAWIFGLLIAALMLEWASRRMRGAR
jgi:hypothetical protein